VKVLEVEYSALRSRPGFENERVTIRLRVDEGEFPEDVLLHGKLLVDEFLGPSQVVVQDIPPGDDPIVPDEPTLPVLEQ